MDNNEQQMTEAQRNEVFLQSQVVRETTFREWLEGKDIEVPDATLLQEMNTKINANTSSVEALKTHNHDNLYAKVGHTHSEAYAEKSHNHNTVYSPINHNHDGVYSKEGHNHDSSYASKSSEHTHSNKSQLDTITSEKISNWNNAYNDTTSLKNKVDTINATLVNSQKYKLTDDDGRVKYITTNNLDITTLPPGNYACVASRFPKGLPLSGYDEGYIDIEVRENYNGAGIRRTITVHYNYVERTFIGHLHHTYGITQWVELSHDKGLQPFYENEKESLTSKIESVSNENTKTIGFITDTHYIKNGRGEYSVNGLMHIENIVDVMGYGLGDLIVHGGDAINGKNSCLNIELMDVNKALLSSPIPSFFCKGNHDNGSWRVQNQDDKSYKYIVDGVKWNHLVTSKYKTKYGIICDENNSGCNYGYYDFPDVKLRCIMLDVLDHRKEDITDEQGNVSVDTSTFCIGQQQMDWIANVALKFPSDEWSVIVFSHIAWYSPTDNSVSRVRNGYQVHRMLKALNEHIQDSCNNTSQSYGTKIDFDFRNTNHRVIATVCGHNHNDATFVKEGVRYIYCANSACTFATNDNRALMTETEDLWTTFTIDTKERKLYLNRFGANKDFEMELNF